jgi:hypothetical protein
VLLAESVATNVVKGEEEIVGFEGQFFVPQGDGVDL